MSATTSTSATSGPVPTASNGFHSNEASIVRRMSLDNYKGESDLKEYRVVELKNGLRGLLISSSPLLTKSGADASLTKAAAALSVGVGSFSDPESLEGCAHFLEHMVFMGSDKYPEENHYDAFVSSHGGSCNAFTEGEYTCFSFDVQAEHFTTALDIFAQCLQAPLLSGDAIEREVQAIENEFQLAQMEDGSRLQQLVSHLSEPSHPLHKFSWGNKRSLVDLPAEKELPIGDVLRSFYETNYFPANAQLVVCAPQSLDDLERVVMESFAHWKRIDAESMALSLDETHLSKKLCETQEQTSLSTPSLLEALSQPLFPTDEFSRLTRLASVKNTHRLTMYFPLPPTLRDHSLKSAEILSHCLGHEASGSILSALKALNLAISLSAGVGESSSDCHSGGSLLCVSVKLSKEGLANWPVVVRMVFDYLAMMQRELLVDKEDRVKYIFDELHTMGDLSVRFRDEEDAYDLTERLSVSLLPLFAQREENVLTSDLTFPQWDAQRLLALVRECSVDRVKIFLSSPVFAEKKTSSEDDDDEEGEGEEDDDEEEDEESGSEDSEDEDDEDSEGEDEDEDEDEEEETESETLSLADIVALCDAGCAQWRHLLLCDESERESVVWEREPWFDVRHSHCALPQSLRAYWRDNAPHNAVLHLPPHNPYIPQIESERESESGRERERKRRCLCHSPSATVCLTAAPLPQRLSTLSHNTADDDNDVDAHTTPSYIAYYTHDTRFARPKADLFLSLCSTQLALSPAHAVARDLSQRLLEDSLTHTLYLADLANLSLSLRSSSSADELAWTFSLSGFSHKLLSLTQHALSVFLSGEHILLSTIHDNTEENNKIAQIARLAKFKQLLTDEYANALLKSENVANENRLSLLLPQRVTLAEKLAYTQSEAFVKELNGESLFAVHRALCGSTQCTMLCEGDVCEEDVRQTLCGVVAAVRVVRESERVALSPSDDLARTVRLPPHNIFLHHGFARSVSERNVAVELYFQSRAYSHENQARIELLENLLSEPFFDQLRTKKQLGYSVSCGMRQSYGVLGFVFKVVSSSHDLYTVLGHMLRFAFSAPALCDAFPLSHVQSVVDSLTQQKRAPDLSLSDASSAHWNTICELKPSERDFEVREKQAAWLSATPTENHKAQAVQLARELFLEQCRVIVSLATPRGAGDDEKNAAQHTAMCEKEIKRLVKEFFSSPSTAAAAPKKKNIKNNKKQGKGGKSEVDNALTSPTVHVLRGNDTVSRAELLRIAQSLQ